MEFTPTYSTADKRFLFPFESDGFLISHHQFRREQVLSVVPGFCSLNRFRL